MHDILIIYDRVPVDLCALPRLDVLDAHGLFADTINNRLVNTQRVRDIDDETQCHER